MGLRGAGRRRRWNPLSGDERDEGRNFTLFGFLELSDERSCVLLLLYIQREFTSSANISTTFTLFYMHLNNTSLFARVTRVKI